MHKVHAWCALARLTQAALPSTALPSHPPNREGRGRARALPRTARPSYTLVSMAEWCAAALSVCSRVGSKTMTSASEPAASTPLRGYALNARAAAVLVRRTKSDGVIRPARAPATRLRIG